MWKTKGDSLPAADAEVPNLVDGRVGGDASEADLNLILIVIDFSWVGMV